MLYYNKQIIYIDYMEAGSKVKNAGFLRKEETEDTITWNMQIKGLYETDTGFFDLRDETGALIDKVLLKRGTGSYERQFTAGGVSRRTGIRRDLRNNNTPFSGQGSDWQMEGQRRVPEGSGYFSGGGEEKEICSPAGRYGAI